MYRPEQIKLAVSRQDGGVTIVSFVTKSFFPRGDGVNDVEFEIEPTKENVEKVLNKHGWTGDLAWTSYRFISDNEIPQDRTFREAWKDDGKLDVDMPKAREIYKDNLRRQRAPLLAALDVEFMRAVEADDKAKQADIAAQKQALRDVTDKPEIEAARTPDDLKTIGII